ncbi:MAG: hypothetical protein EHM20_01280, partial [Alphaproteobacteria bacterium]
MMKTKNLFISFLFLAISSWTYATDDVGQVVSGSEVEDVLGAIKETGSSPYIVKDSKVDELENYKLDSDAQPDFIFGKKTDEVSVKDDPRKKYEDVGYTLPGTFEKNENYLEHDK